ALLAEFRPDEKELGFEKPDVVVPREPALYEAQRPNDAASSVSDHQSTTLERVVDPIHGVPLVHLWVLDADVLMPVQHQPIDVGQVLGRCITDDDRRANHGGHPIPSVQVAAHLGMATVMVLADPAIGIRVPRDWIDMAGKLVKILGQLAANPR